MFLVFPFQLFVICSLSFLIPQLELKCFSQQEQLDSLQEQLDQEKERAESKQLALEKELALRVDQVRRGQKWRGGWRGARRKKR